MVSAMTVQPHACLAEDISGVRVTGAAGIPGGRHEVLPPRQIAGGRLLLRTASRVVPP
jgi:hypothetical protein